VNSGPIGGQAAGNGLSDTARPARDHCHRPIGADSQDADIVPSKLYDRIRVFDAIKRLANLAMGAFVLLNLYRE
jgi:hypothetical protein